MESGRDLEGFFSTTLGQTDFRSDGSYVELVPKLSLCLFEACFDAGEVRT